MEEDPFDSLLTLEDTFYDEGYKLGVADGSLAGRIEGRVFGLEKGFEKYLSMGILQGRSAVLAGRLAKVREQEPDAVGITPAHPSSQAGELQLERPDAEGQKISQPLGSGQASDTGKVGKNTLPTLPDNPRLEKHIQTLYALVEAASLSTDNTEEAVSDFDDRFKRASAKAKVIERLIGETSGLYEDGSGANAQSNGPYSGLEQGSKSNGDGSIEDMSSLQARH